MLAQAVAVVLGEMKADGSFGALLDKYGVKPYDGPFDVVGPASCIARSRTVSRR